MINADFWSQVADRWTSVIDFKEKQNIKEFGGKIATDTGGEINENFSNLGTYINNLDLGGLLDDL